MRTYKNTDLCNREHQRTMGSAGGLKIHLRGELFTTGSAEGAKIQVRCQNTGKYTSYNCKTLPTFIVVINVRHFYLLLL